MFKNLFPVTTTEPSISVRSRMKPIHLKSGERIFTKIAGNITVYTTEEPTWVSVIKDEMYAYSAFRDPRYTCPVVKVIVSTNSMKDKNCHCRLWMVSGQVEIIESKVPASFQQLPGGTGRSRQYFLLCTVDKNNTKNPASHVDIVCDSNPPENNLLQITGPQIQLRYNFTMCLCPVFGYDVTRRDFIEYLEVNRMFGADHFIIYNMTKTPKHLFPIIHAYQQVGLMTVYQWDISINQSFYYFGETVALNDCLYRSMYHSHYMVNTDIDEFIVPLKHRSWSKAIEEVDKRNRTCEASSYSFLHLFFDKTKQRDQMNEEKSQYVVDHMKILTRFLPMFPILKHTTRSKFIGVPQKATLAGIHYIFEGVSGTDTKIVPTDIGLLFHYRDGIPFGHKKEQSGFNPYRMLDFRNTIIRRMARAPYKYDLQQY